MSTKPSYFGMTPEQKSLLAAKRIEAEHTLDEWEVLLRSLAELDRAGDSLRKWGIGLGIGGVVTGFFFPPLWLVAAGGAGAFFYTRKKNLDNDVRDNLLRVLALLRPEVPADRPVHLRVDLSGPTPEKKTGEKPPVQQGTYRVSETIFTDAWMEGAARLSDGSRLRWRVTTITRKVKKSGRKTKWKTKTKHRVDVRLALPTRRYEHSPSDGARFGRPKTQVSAGPKKITAKAQASTRDAGAVTHTLRSLMAHLYEQVTPAREAAR